jgi:hypothetical protein
MRRSRKFEEELALLKKRSARWTKRTRITASPRRRRRHWCESCRRPVDSFTLSFADVQLVHGDKEKDKK